MASERSARPGDPLNIQDGFLNDARREGHAVLIQLMDGTRFEGRIKCFDRFAVIVEQDGADRMIFKHAIASITASRPVTSGASPR